MNITERFLSYVKFDTQSSEEAEGCPSTPKQLVFAEYLKNELVSEGLTEVEMDEHGYIYAERTPYEEIAKKMPRHTPLAIKRRMKRMSDKMSNFVDDNS